MNMASRWADFEFRRQKEKKMAIGIMSGTSLDGFDVALVGFGPGSGWDTCVELLAFRPIPFSEEFRSILLALRSQDSASLLAISLCHKQWSILAAKAVLEFIDSIGYSKEDIDFIASHGQTIYHAPLGLHGHESVGHVTFQIGDGDILAHHTGIHVVSDFRQGMIANGYEGAPLAPIVDQLLWRSDTRERIFLNIGGISNFTFVPVKGSELEVCFGDLGPGNTLMDTYVQSVFGIPFDKDGLLTAKGSVDVMLLQQYQTAYFSLNKSGSTGQEVYNEKFIWNMGVDLLPHTLKPEDILSTLCYFTAWTIAEGLNPFVKKYPKPEIFISGGGIYHPGLVAAIRGLLPACDIHFSSELGINPDAKEAVIFAVLGHESMMTDRTPFHHQHGGEIFGSVPCLGKWSLVQRSNFE